MNKDQQLMVDGYHKGNSSFNLQSTLGDYFEVLAKFDNIQKAASTRADVLALSKIESPSERLHNLFVAAMTAIPLVGTVYNVVSYRHIV